MGYEENIRLLTEIAETVKKLNEKKKEMNKTVIGSFNFYRTRKTTKLLNYRWI